MFLEENGAGKELAPNLTGLLNLNKSDLAEIASNILQDVNDGWVDPLDALIYAKKGEVLFKSIVDAVKDKAEMPESKYTKHDADLVEKMVGVSYDYSACGDIEWEMIDAQIKDLSEKKKERETFLKSLKSKLTLVNEDTGETYSVEPPVQKGKMSIAITLK